MRMLIASEDTEFSLALISWLAKYPDGKGVEITLLSDEPTRAEQIAKSIVEIEHTLGART